MGKFAHIISLFFYMYDCACGDDCPLCEGCRNSLCECTCYDDFDDDDY